MSLNFPDGAVFGFSTAAAASVAASAVSNASPAVATVSADTIAEDDVLILMSAWDLANNTVAVAGSIADDQIELLGIDSTDTDLFPASAAAMRISVASDFVDFSQQDESGLATTGGEQQSWTGRFLESKARREISVPTYVSATQFTLPLFYDPKLPWYTRARAVAAKHTPIVLRCVLPNRDRFFWYGYLGFSADPKITGGTPMNNVMTFSPMGETTLVEAAA